MFLFTLSHKRPHAACWALQGQGRVVLILIFPMARKTLQAMLFLLVLFFDLFINIIYESLYNKNYNWNVLIYDAIWTPLKCELWCCMGNIGEILWKYFSTFSLHLVSTIRIWSYMISLSISFHTYIKHQ